jgi:hypothetical protein
MATWKAKTAALFTEIARLEANRDKVGGLIEGHESADEVLNHLNDAIGILHEIAGS